MSSFKLCLTLLHYVEPRVILPTKMMTQLFSSVNFIYRSIEVYRTFCNYLRVLVRIRNFYDGGRHYLHWQFATVGLRPFI